jgi:hypothetical protein
MKILYNDTFGSFEFSEAFLAEYKSRTGKELNIVTALFHTGANSIRCDPTAISLFEERGSEWVSGPNACLAIRDIPDLFARYWDIDESDGNETVRVNVSDALADVLDTYMETRDHAALERQYASVRDACRALAASSHYGLHAEDITPTSEAAPPQLIVGEEDA